MDDKAVQDVAEAHVAAIRAQLRALLTFLAVSRRKPRTRKIMVATIKALKEFIFIA